MASLSPAPVSQFFDANGNPLAGGKLHTYISGTTTPLATFDAQNGTVNTNPIILNSRGEANIWLSNKLYTFALTNAFDEAIWTVNAIGTVTTGFFNVMDYGAVGNGVTDDTVAFQAAIAAATAGGVIYAPAGTYKITANLNINWPKLCVLRGDGSKLTTLLDYRINVDTGGLINYNASGLSSVDTELSTSTGGFSLIRMVNPTVVTGQVITTIGSGMGLWVNGVINGVYSDIAVRGYHTSIYLTNCRGFALRDVYATECQYGIYLTSLAGTLGPLASVIENATITDCGVWGVYISGGMVQVTGGKYQRCGTMTTTSGAIYFGSDTALMLPQTILVNSGLFEGNRGSADVYIEARINTEFSSAVTNCLFGRFSNVYYTTNNIYVLNVNIAGLQFSANGNGFRGYAPYVANIARLYIVTSGTIDHSYFNNTYFDPIEAPTTINTNFSLLGFGAQGARLGDAGLIPTLYAPTTVLALGNNAGGIVLDATSWRPLAANVFGLGTTTYPFSSAAITGAITWNGYTVAAPTGGTTYLKNDGTWDTPAGGGATNYSYTGTVTGLTITITGTVTYTRVGDMVTMNLFNGALGVSNSTSMTITGGTVNMRPASDKWVLMGIGDNGALGLGVAIIQPSGVIDFRKDVSGSPFTASGIKAFSQTSFSYTLV